MSTYKCSKCGNTQELPKDAVNPVCSSCGGAMLPRKKKRIWLRIVLILLAAVIAFFGYNILDFSFFQVMNDYKEAEEELSRGQYQYACWDFQRVATELKGNPVTRLLAGIGGYADAAERVDEPYYVQAEQYLAKNELDSASKTFKSIPDYRDAAERAYTLYADYADTLFQEGQIESARTYYKKAYEVSESTYEKALDMQHECDYLAAAASEAEGSYGQAANQYQLLADYKDSKQKEIDCYIKLAEQHIENDNFVHARSVLMRCEDAEEAVKLNGMMDAYSSAAENQKNKNWFDAIDQYAALGDFHDAAQRMETCQETVYNSADTAYKKKDFQTAYSGFLALKDYKDSAERAAAIEQQYQDALAYENSKQYELAAEGYKGLYNYRDSSTRATDCVKVQAEAYVADNNLAAAADTYETIRNLPGVVDWLDAYYTDCGDQAYAAGQYADAIDAFLKATQTDDVKQRIYQLGEKAFDEGEFEHAARAFGVVGQYGMSVYKLPIAQYAWGEKLFETGEYAKAEKVFKELGEYNDAAERAAAAAYEHSVELMNAGMYAEAIEAIASLNTDEAKLQRKKCYYLQAEFHYQNGDYINAEESFDRAFDYSDAAARKTDAIRAQADTHLSKQEYAQAEADYSRIGEYGDGYKESRLQQGIELMNANEFQEALTFLEDLNYSNSIDVMKQCYDAWADTCVDSAYNYKVAIDLYQRGNQSESTRTKLMQLAQKCAAKQETGNAIKALWACGDYEPALSLLSDMRGLLALNGDTENVLVADILLGNVKENVDVEKLIQIVNGFDCYYYTDFRYDLLMRCAAQLLDAGYAEQALYLYHCCRTHTDTMEIIKADSRLADIWNQKLMEVKAKYPVGQTVNFGSYQNTKLVWRVIALDEHKALFLCEALVAPSPYGGSSWENSTVRKWLNDTFFNEAFTQNMQGMILPTTLEGYSAEPDMLFLLSLEEAEEYLTSVSNRKCSKAKYVKGRCDSDWWLRDVNDRSAAVIHSDGSIDPIGDGVSFEYNGVRPALWFDLSTQISFFE